MPPSDVGHSDPGSAAVPAWFVDSVGRHCRERQSTDLAAAVGADLRRLVAAPGWLAPRHRLPSPTAYRQHVLYVAPDGAFSVVSLVWAPGQATVIHDHVAWCAVGVYEGMERETRYRLHAQGGQAFLVEAGTSLARAGDTGVLVPPAEDIHQVACAGHELAVSIHVYGADIGRLGTSINHRFEDIPVLPDSPAGSDPARWRDFFRS